jgi:hypothetical protein
VAIGWVSGNNTTNQFDPTPLINTETTVADVLGLAALLSLLTSK